MPTINPKQNDPSQEEATSHKVHSVFGMRVEFGTTAYFVWSLVLGVVGALIGLVLAPLINQIVDRSFRVVDAEERVVTKDREITELEKKLESAKQVVAANERIALYGADFTFYRQTTTKRGTLNTLTITPDRDGGSIVFNENTEIRNDKYALVTITKPLLDPERMEIRKWESAQRGGYRDDPTFPMLLVPGSRLIGCTKQADFIVVIEKAEINELRVGVALAPGTKKGDQLSERNAWFGVDSECARYDRN
jgi:hypothetical protein